MKKQVCLFFVLIALLLAPIGVQAQSKSAVVRAVLFYSPTCPHCHEVINEDLPPLVEKYGEQLLIIGVDVSTSDGQLLYQAAIESFAVPETRYGVPALFVGGQHLVGSNEIPEMFPGIIEEGLAQGGIGWPNIPPLLESLAAEGLLEAGTGAAADIERGPAIEELRMADRFRLDVVGNSISVVVLLGLAASLVMVARRYQKGEQAPAWPKALVSVLILAGILVAGYLTFVEVTQTDAVCGPVGNCDLVHQSQYAFLFGLIPVGLLGYLGYMAIGTAWVVNLRQAEGDGKRFTAQLLFGFAAIGTFFSIYLTFLEPFVIGATCSWCLISAVIMALLLWAFLPLALPYRQAEQVEMQE